MKPLRNWAIVGVTALVIGALALAACGSDADQQAQQSATPTVAAQTQQQQVAEPPAAADGQEQTAQQTAQQADEEDEQSAATVDSDDGTQQQAAADQQSGEQPAADSAADEQQAEQPTKDELQADEQAEEQAEEQAVQEAGPAEAERLRLRAEEIAANASISDLRGIEGWLNGEETSIALELAKGNVVLIDFWTYTCVNCIRTLPFLIEWQEKYGDRGLTIIGVHSPEFEFEKERANVEDAIEQYGIEWLVAQDNEFSTWRAFNNRYWPAKYLIGPEMNVLYQHFGEGDYLETEQEIREALEEAGWDLSGIEEGTTAVAPRRDPVSQGQTRELYGGTHRNYGRIQYAAQPEFYLAADVAQEYTDIEEGASGRETNKWYLQGLWHNGPEAIVHARNTTDLEDYLAFKFTARTVNVVLTLEDGAQPFDVFIEMNGRWLEPSEAGDDIDWDADGRSFVRVTKNDLFRLVKLPEWSTHELKLSSNSNQLAIFAFTFGSYLGGE